MSITPAGLFLLFLYDKKGKSGHMAKKVFLYGNEPLFLGDLVSDAGKVKHVYDK